MTARIERFIPALVFVASLAVLWWNAAPSVTFHDSGEMALAAASAGIPHPPGMPTWTALASLFIRIGQFDDPARGTNLFSGLCAAASLGLLSLLVLRWTRRLWPQTDSASLLAGTLLAPLILLQSSAFLEQSLITEQYTLMVLLIALMLCVSTSLLPTPPSESVPPTPPHNLRALTLLFLLGVLWGLAIGNHLSQLALGLLVVWAGILHAGSPFHFRAILASAIPAFFGWIFGLLIFLWLPLRSAANPILDWGYIRNWENFVFAVTRQQWPTRPISAAPRGYIHEWLITYDFLGQMGILGFVLALVGLFLLMRRNKIFLGWLFAVSIPYAAGMLLGHMREDGKNIGYIRQYGVTDWHLPIYFAGALAAGIACATVLSSLRTTRGFRFSTALACIILFLSLFLCVRSMRSASLRHFNAPNQFISDLLAPIPDDAVIAVVGDNCANMLNYDRHQRDTKSNRYVVYALMQLPRRIQEIYDHEDTWNEAQKLLYLQSVLMRPLYQPIRIPPMNEERARSAQIFVDNVSPYEASHPYMVPAGLLYEVQMSPSSPEQIRLIESQNQKSYPELFLPPQHTPHRLEAEARAVMHQDRALYFIKLGLWSEAESALALSLAWVPENGELWYRLGTVQEQLGQNSKAEVSYQNAIALAEFLSDARNNLGVLYAQRGNLDAAIACFEEELSYFPKSTKAIVNLERALNDRATLRQE